MIAFRAFTKRFGRHTAADALTFDVAAGEVVALVGPNGSGKTTTIKAAAGLIRPTAGGVFVGYPPRLASEASSRHACAFLPQNVAFPALLTGREVVEFHCALRGLTPTDVNLALQAAALNGASDRPIGTYSGGMVQRLGLGLAVAADVPLLLLDEPTAALDPEGLQTFYHAIDAHRGRGRTVLFSSHQLGDVERVANRFVILVGGRLVASWSASELAVALADRGVMKVAIDRATSAVLDSARRLVPETVLVDNLLIVPGPATVRPAVLDALRTAGVEIRALTTEDGRLEDLYRDLVANPQATPAPERPAHDRRTP